MESIALLDRAGRRRSPATTSTFHRDVSPGNKGLRYPPDPPTVEEIVAVMRAAGDCPEGVRLRGVIVVLWRAGLRISEALALNESDLDPDRGSLLVCRERLKMDKIEESWTLVGQETRQLDNRVTSDSPDDQRDAARHVARIRPGEAGLWPVAGSALLRGEEQDSG